MSVLLIAFLAPLTYLADEPAQAEPPPAAYTATIVKSIHGALTIKTKVYRDGSKAVVDQFTPLTPSRPGGAETGRSRAYYDLESDTWFSTNLNIEAVDSGESTGFPVRPIAVAERSKAPGEIPS